MTSFQARPFLAVLENFATANGESTYKDDSVKQLLTRGAMRWAVNRSPPLPPLVPTQVRL